MITVENSQGTIVIRYLNGQWQSYIKEHPSITATGTSKRYAINNLMNKAAKAGKSSDEDDYSLDDRSHADYDNSA